MNIFFLHLDVRKCASYYFDKHCVKIILEITQMLYTAHWMTNDDLVLHHHPPDLAPYRKTHYNHPTAKWVRQHINNYLYTCQMGLALCAEYTLRMNKVHKCQVRLEWLYNNLIIDLDDAPIDAYLATHNIPSGCTPVPLAMPEEYHTSNLIESYRMYYIHGKQHIARTHAEWLALKHEWVILSK